MAMTEVTAVQMMRGIWGSAPRMITLGSMMAMRQIKGTSARRRGGCFRTLILASGEAVDIVGGPLFPQILAGRRGAPGVRKA